MTHEVLHILYHFDQSIGHKLQGEKNSLPMRPDLKSRFIGLRHGPKCDTLVKTIQYRIANLTRL